MSVKAFYDKHLSMHQKAAYDFLVRRCDVLETVSDLTHAAYGEADYFPRGACIFHHMGTGKTRLTFLLLVRHYGTSKWSPSIVVAKEACLDAWEKTAAHFNAQTGSSHMVMHITGKTTASDIRESLASVFFITPSLLQSWYKRARNVEWHSYFPRMTHDPVNSSVKGVHTYPIVQDPDLEKPWMSSTLASITSTQKGPEMLFFGMHFQCVAIDEAHFLRNGATTWNYVALRALSTDCRVALTGSPYFKNRDDIGNILCFLGIPDRWLMYDRTKQVMISVQTNDSVVRENPNMRLPPLHMHVRPLQFGTPEEAQMYSKHVQSTVVCAHRYIEIREGRLLGAKEARKKHSGNIVALRRCCAAPCTVYQKKLEMAEPWEGTECTKVKEIMRILQQHPNENVIVTGFLVDPLEIYYRVLRSKGISCGIYTGRQKDPKMRRRILQRAQGKSPFRVFLLSFGVGSESLNLQGYSVMVMASPNYVPADVAQMVARIYRQGQDLAVHIYQLVIAGTYESTIFSICAARAVEMKTQAEEMRLAQVLLDPVFGYCVRDGSAPAFTRVNEKNSVATIADRLGKKKAAAPAFTKVSSDEDVRRILDALNEDNMREADSFLMQSAGFRSSTFEEREAEREMHDRQIRTNKRYWQEMSRVTSEGGTIDMDYVKGKRPRPLTHAEECKVEGGGVGQAIEIE